MWRGLVLSDSGQPTSAAYQLVVQTNSTISHALCAVKAEASTPARFAHPNRLGRYSSQLPAEVLVDGLRPSPKTRSRLKP